MILTVSLRRAVTAVSVDKYPQTTNILPYLTHMLLENLSVQTHARNAGPARMLIRGGLMRISVMIRENFIFAELQIALCNNNILQIFARHCN